MGFAQRKLAIASAVLLLLCVVFLISWMSMVPSCKVCRNDPDLANKCLTGKGYSSDLGYVLTVIHGGNEGTPLITT
jgi:hypothetical protein